MKKEWFTAKELVSIAGLPTTPQAINQRAKKEEWLRQRRTGIQGGRAVEYHISSLPHKVVAILQVQEISSPEYHVNMTQSEKAWWSIFYQLTEYERSIITAFVLREGINALLDRIGVKQSATLTSNEQPIPSYGSDLSPSKKHN